MKRLAWIILFLVIVVVIALSLVKYTNAPSGPLSETPTNSESNGAPVNMDVLTLDSPKPGDLIKSPLTVTGKARGFWYFEASFPVKILDGNGNELAAVPAQAQSEWMTTKMVPFVAKLTFKTPATATGTLLLEKDNPSGLPSNAQEIRYPIRFR